MSKGGWLAAFRYDWRSAARSFRSALNHRISNRLQDRRAVLAGACNATTWSDALVSYRGGYPHWRCGKAAGHKGWHRFNNYVWAPDPFGRVRYDSLPVHGPNYVRPPGVDPLPFALYAEGRHTTLPARQDRLMRRLAEANLILARLRRAAEEDWVAKYGKRSVNDYTDDL
jgi:hypothetical protein